MSWTELVDGFDWGDDNWDVPDGQQVAPVDSFDDADNFADNSPEWEEQC